MIINNLRLNTGEKEIELSASVTFNNRKYEEIFFRVDNEYTKFIANDASPFLACLLFPAMKLGEDIYIDTSISPQLLINMQKIMKIVSSWDIGLKTIKVTAKSTVKDQESLGNIGTFFSGGVDSFATYLRNKSHSSEKINYFIFVHGFDISLKDKDVFGRVYKKIQSIAKEENIKLIVVKTNLREVTDPILSWGYCFGGAMGGVSLLLGKGFKKVYIPGSVRQDQAHPWGSHMDIDPLWTTEKLKTIHDSSDLGRLQKIKLYIAKSPLALKYLRVCWLNYKYNCGHCSKCIRTMLELNAVNALNKSKSLPNKLNIKRIRKLNLASHSEMIFYGEVLAELKRQGRDKEIQDAIEHIIELSKNPTLKRRMINLIGSLDKKLNKNRLFFLLSKKGLIQ